MTVEPIRIPGRPDVTHAVVERYSRGYTSICFDNTRLRPGDTLESVARRFAALFRAEFVEVGPVAAGYTAARELPVDCVYDGDQVARPDGDGVRWATVTWVDDGAGELCPRVPRCSGVLGFDDGTEVHYDVVDRPMVRIPVAVTA